MEISGQSSDALRNEFMTLLVAQLRNQDPLQPVQQQDFLSQLAQFSTLESIENLGTRFDSLLKLQELSYGAELIGKSVVYDTPDGHQSGVVHAAFVDQGEVVLDVDGQIVEAASLLGIANA